MRIRDLFVAASMIAITASCTDIIEKDLSDRSINVMTPPDNYTTTLVTNTFWWEEVEGAFEYHLQIVSPSFTNLQRLELDSNIMGERIDVTLAPGTYQWRIAARNGSSNTPYVIRTLVIDSTQDISSQTIILRNPADGLATSSTTVTFDWDSLYAADEYRIQVASPNFSNGSNIFLDVTTAASEYAYSFIMNGDFEWRVRGQNASSNTLYSTRSLVIDTIPPEAPVLTSPSHNASLDSLPVTMTWTYDTDAVGDSVYVYHPDSTTLLTGYPVYVTANSYSFDHSSVDSVYHWKLRSVDRAGLASPFSALFKFTVK